MSIKRLNSVYALVILWVVLSACSSPDQDIRATEPTLLPTYQDNFVDAGTWDTYNRETLIIDVAGEMLRGVFSQSGRYAWSLNHITHTNVAIEITVTDVSSHDSGFMGLMCRASPQNNGRGYHFLISGDGAYSIRYGTGNGDEALVRWQNHGAIRSDGSNRLRVVCDGSQLSFFANGRRLNTVRDERYSRGSVGVMLGLSRSVTAGTSVDVAFDDLSVWDLEE